MSPGASRVSTSDADETTKTSRRAKPRRRSRYRPMRELLRPRPAVPHGDRVGVPQQLRAQDRRRQVADARAHAHVEARRHEVQRRQVLGEDLLHLVEELLPLGVVDVAACFGIS